MGKLRGTVSYTPVPDGPSPVPEIMQRLCKDPHPILKPLCDCFFGDPDACPPEPEDPPGQRLPTCSDLCTSYNEALQCAMRFCDGRQASIGTLTREQYGEWVTCQNDIERYWQQLHDQGCFNRLQPIDVILALAQAQFR